MTRATRAVRPVRALAVLALLVGACAACGTSDETGTGDRARFRVVLDWTPNTNHAGMYLAEAEGWYDAAGLDVSFAQPGDADPLQLVSAGKAEVAVSIQEAVLPARQHGLPVVSVAAIIQHNTSGLVSLASEGIERPRDLEGKTYGGYGAELETALVKNLVECDGGDPSKVRTVNVGEADYKVGLERDQYDYVWIFDGWDGIRLEDEDVETNELRFADHTDCIPDWYTPLLATSERIAKERADDLEAFMAATARGYRAAMDDPQAAADALLEAAPDLDRDLVEASAEYLSTRYADDPEEWGHQDAKVWSSFAQFLVEAKVLDDADTEGAWTNEFLT